LFMVCKTGDGRKSTCYFGVVGVVYLQIICASLERNVSGVLCCAVL
jgi:hypothetical protein